MILSSDLRQIYGKMQAKRLSKKCSQNIFARFKERCFRKDLNLTEIL